MVDAYGMLLGFVGEIGVSLYTERPWEIYGPDHLYNCTYRICEEPLLKCMRIYSKELEAREWSWHS